MMFAIRLYDSIHVFIFSGITLDAQTLKAL